MSNIKVSAVVVTLNAARSIEKCLGGIFRQKGDWEIEVVLIDSSSRGRDARPGAQVSSPGPQYRAQGIPSWSDAKPRRVHDARRVPCLPPGRRLASQRELAEELLTPFSKNAAVACVYGRQLPKDDCDPVN